MPIRHESHENLVTMISVVVVGVMIALVAKMVEQHSVPMILPVEPVKGYVRPDQAQNEQDKVDALTAMAHKKPQIKPADMALIKQRFDQAVALLHGKQYDYAIVALDDVLKLQDDMPEVYVNMGYAYLGLKDFASATSAFQRAIDLNPGQTNAYYGLAIAYEGGQDLEMALGAMRSFIHLSDPKDKFLPRARAAIWEWEAEMGRIKGVSAAPEQNGESAGAASGAAANPKK